MVWLWWPSDTSLLDALRTHYRAFAAGPMTGVDTEVLVSRVRVIFDSPALGSAADALLYQQRQKLAEVLAAEHGETAAALMAAQISASLVTLQETFFRRLAAGASLADARRRLAGDVELAFGLLAHGLDPSAGGDRPAHDEPAPAGGPATTDGPTPAATDGPITTDGPRTTGHHGRADRNDHRNEQ
ncbi:hypothetical protein [Streptomyces lydicus]|uniref:hypothetical protein n=1 Tax=Streptomyces lydicus TaxID=47763 RepID=UPI0036FD247C